MLRWFSLTLLIIASFVAGFLLFHEPAARNVFDQFGALNVDAAISAENGWLIVTVLIIAARTVIFLVFSVLGNLFRRRWWRATLALVLLILKPLLAWMIYLLLFVYSREIGFSRLLWNLQDLGIQADLSAVLLIGTFNALCILILPDLLLGALFGRHELGMVRPPREKHKREPITVAE